MESKGTRKQKFPYYYTQLFQYVCTSNVKLNFIWTCNHGSMVKKNMKELYVTNSTLHIWHNSKTLKMLLTYIKPYDYIIERAFPLKVIRTAYTRVQWNALKIYCRNFPLF